MRCSYWPKILQSHGYGCSFYEYTFRITFLQAFTRIWLSATFVVTLSFLGNTPAFCSCCISVASDDFSSAVGVPLGGQRSLLAQQTCTVAASGSCTYAGLSWCAIAICRISQISLCSPFSQILSSKVLLQVFNSVTYWSTVPACLKRIGNVKMIHCFVGYTVAFCYVSLTRSFPPPTSSTETRAFALVLLSSALIAKWISNCLTVSVLYCIPAGKDLMLDPVIRLLVLPRAPGNH